MVYHRNRRTGEERACCDICSEWKSWPNKFPPRQPTDSNGERPFSLGDRGDRWPFVCLSCEPRWIRQQEDVK